MIDHDKLINKWYKDYKLYNRQVDNSQQLLEYVTKNTYDNIHRVCNYTFALESVSRSGRSKGGVKGYLRLLYLNFINL
jgi:hypothetical protein